MAPMATVKDENSALENQQVVRLSISHDGDYATALVIAAEEPVVTENAGIGG